MIISSTRQVFSYFGPFISIFLVGLNDGNILIISPLVFLDARVKVVVPSFSALFANSSGQSLCNVTPIFCAKLFDIKCKPIIFILTPRSFDHGWVQNFLPPVQALDISPLIKERGYSLPVPSPVFLNKLRKLVVFFSVPISFSVLRVLRILNLIMLSRRKRCVWPML
jgi:hypothetical protein